VKLTVAICTWNRAALLDQTLTGMRELRVPPGASWELLVIDNNSTDDTKAVVAKHESALPVVYLFEPKQGHSNARNAGIEAANSDLLIWTDDDVIVDPSWLIEYAAAAEAFPDAAFFGGTIDPWFAVEPPAWVVRNLPALHGPFAIRQLGPEVRRLGDGELVFGASLAFRTLLLKEHRFNPELGRKGTGMLSGDETDLLARLRALGHYGVWVGSAKVRHYIPADRLTTGYVWKFFHGLGRTTQRLAPHDRGVPRVLGAPRWMVRRYLAARGKMLLHRPGRGQAWMDAFTKAAVARGIIDECRTNPTPAGA
jgi:glucosyl-dolichyl phosphate glucuronosyltransferase